MRAGDPGPAPDFFDVALTDREQQRVRDVVRQRQDELRGRNTKLQYFAAAFSRIGETSGRMIHLFLYLTRSGTGRETEEIVLPGDQVVIDA